MGSSQPKDQICISCLAGGFFTTEPPGKPLVEISSLQFKEIGYSDRVEDNLDFHMPACWVTSVISNSLQLYELVAQQSMGFLCPWDSLGKNTGVGCRSLLQGNLPKPGIEPASLMSPALAAAAKSLQSCPTLCDPMDGSPPGSSVHRILQARTLEWVAVSFSIQHWQVGSLLLVPPGTLDFHRAEVLL